VPDGIRLVGILANAALGVIFGFLAIFTLSEGQVAMAIFFALISALAAFNWHVIRKAAAVIATQASERAALERQLATHQQHQGTPP
jgi:predicted lipid-binding transport protein (Tim44 family)